MAVDAVVVSAIEAAVEASAEASYPPVVVGAAVHRWTTPNE